MAGVAQPLAVNAPRKKKPPWAAASVGVGEKGASWHSNATPQKGH